MNDVAVSSSIAPAAGPIPYRGEGASTDIALELHDLTVSYHRKPVLWNVDLAVPRGKLVGIIGMVGRETRGIISLHRDGWLSAWQR